MVVTERVVVVGDQSSLPCGVSKPVSHDNCCRLIRFKDKIQRHPSYVTEEYNAKVI